MEKRTGVSTGFIIVISLFVLGISGFFYIREMKGLENTISIPAKIVTIKNVPKICILGLDIKDERFSGKILTTTVPSWDSRRIGERILVRLNLQNPSNVEVDKFIYLHRTSMGILAGTAFLFVILLVVKVIKGNRE